MKLPFQALHGGIVHKGPFVDGRGIIVPQPRLEAFFIAALHHQFLGFEGAQERSHIVQRALGNLELAGGYVQEGRAAAVLFHRDAAEVVVLLLLQHALAKGNARRNNLSDTAFDQFFGKFRVLQLVADGHFVAGAHQFGEVGFDGMVRESGHGNGAFVPVALLGLDQAQDAGGRNGIVCIGLVKVPYAIQQQRLRVLCLHLEELFDKRCIFSQFCHRSIQC